MRIGAAFPTTEIGNRASNVRDFVRGVEALGFDHITCIDHVIQSATPVADDWRAYYTRDNPFHEVLTLFGFMAGITERIELTTAILILPQRETVLVAKQLAELDVLTEGRIRAGVGIGWNEIEFQSLNQRFSSRAKRMEEQMRLLRALWTEPEVHFEGMFDHVPGAGINPLPVQRPIPLWIGAFAPAAIARAGRLADGLILNPRNKPGRESTRDIECFRCAAVAAERDEARLGLDVTLFTANRGHHAIRDEYEAWAEYRPSHLTVRTMTAGYTTVGEHLDALEQARKALD